MIQRTCKQCKKIFYTTPSEVNRGSGLFCSKRCWGNFKIGKKDIEHSIRMIGHPNWHKGKNAKKTMKCLICQKSFKYYPTVSQHRKFCSFKCFYIYRRKNPIKVIKYKRIHKWIQEQLGKPTKCSYCGKHFTGKKIHWANKNHKYRKKLSDWIRLCSKCHTKYDRLNN